MGFDLRVLSKLSFRTSLGHPLRRIKVSDVNLGYLLTHDIRPYKSEFDEFGYLISGFEYRFKSESSIYRKVQKVLVL